MDEVDAALDEANISRLRELLEELSIDTQFVLITHNRNTVQIADLIYGITMGKDTASQTISLKLEEVDQSVKDFVRSKLMSLVSRDDRNAIIEFNKWLRQEDDNNTKLVSRKKTMKHPSMFSHPLHRPKPKPLPSPTLIRININKKAPSQNKHQNKPRHINKNTQAKPNEQPKQKMRSK